MLQCRLPASLVLRYAVLRCPPGTTNKTPGTRRSALSVRLNHATLEGRGVLYCLGCAERSYPEGMGVRKKPPYSQLHYRPFLRSGCYQAMSNRPLRGLNNNTKIQSSTSKELVVQTSTPCPLRGTQTWTPPTCNCASAGLSPSRKSRLRSPAQLSHQLAQPKSCLTRFES